MGVLTCTVTTITLNMEIDISAVPLTMQVLVTCSQLLPVFFTDLQLYLVCVWGGGDIKKRTNSNIKTLFHDKGLHYKSPSHLWCTQ